MDSAVRVASTLRRVVLCTKVEVDGMRRRVTRVMPSFSWFPEADQDGSGGDCRRTLRFIFYYAVLDGFQQVRTNPQLATHYDGHAQPGA